MIFDKALPILLTIGVFALIIVFHEFGHFVIAKLSRIPVYEFSLGFGRPVLLSFKWRGTRYCLRPFPLGGFVHIAGMEPDEDVPHGFDKKPLLARLGVIAAGSGMNFVLAVIIFWVMGMAFGKIIGVTPKIGRVAPGKPAAAAGMHVGDELLFAEPVPVGKRFPTVEATGTPERTMTLDQVVAVIHSRPDMPIRLVVKRGRGCLAFHVVPRSERREEPKQGRNGKIRMVSRTVGMIGVVFALVTKPQGFGESVVGGFVDVYHTTRLMITGLVMMVTGKLPPAVAGPVGITGIMADAARVGWHDFLMWSALISVNVGFINLLPVPALDGSRLVFIIIGGIRRRPIDRRKEAIVHFVGFALLILLLLLVTCQDILRLIDKHVGPS